MQYVLFKIAKHHFLVSIAPFAPSIYQSNKQNIQVNAKIAWLNIVLFIETLSKIAFVFVEYALYPYLGLYPHI
jgi:hypothetical protein